MTETGREVQNRGWKDKQGQNEQVSVMQVWQYQWPEVAANVAPLM